MTVAAPSSNGASTISRAAAPRSSQRPPSALELIRTADRVEGPPAAAIESVTTVQANQAQPSGFSPEQLAALAAPLNRANVRQREQGRGKVAYLEGWQVIAEANRIFGFDGWQRQTIAMRCVAQAERPIGRDQKPGWGVTYTARVRVTVTAGGLPALVREGSGAGHGIDMDLGQAHESALKEAETDAMKRALMTFGNPFGLALYDKRQREVTSSAAPEHPTAHPRQAEPAPQRQERSATAAEHPAQDAAPASQQDPGLLHLDADTIRQLHGTIRQLPRPLLEALTQGFRKRFSIPEGAATIADRIVQKRHHDWIEAFLVQHSGLTS
ncbi:MULTISPECIES: RAD52 family DNA repair protein [unclassified Cyanobium]|uniref:RAD52 family DNA repair protein n=1 Tax=unclassified Cyanobium TaxID=2627006 RepID=UPI0020CD8108|nr:MULTISPECIES: RAD52 family DNA repair protein [unclassified Cyanobium]MCP9860342.1 RAD52 family DNA repair protein [Cyanobium sp. Cruz-8H5]MCP9867674.1 RAD52 family DNA repair protein [Cyanobium sp. Cruz-8D1]